MQPQAIASPQHKPFSFCRVKSKSTLHYVWQKRLLPWNRADIESRISMRLLPQNMEYWDTKAKQPCSHCDANRSQAALSNTVQYRISSWPDWPIRWLDDDRWKGSSEPLRCLGKRQSLWARTPGLLPSGMGKPLLHTKSHKKKNPPKQLQFGWIRHVFQAKMLTILINYEEL